MGSAARTARANGLPCEKVQFRGGSGEVTGRHEVRNLGRSGHECGVSRVLSLTPSGHLHRLSMLRPRRANASCRTPEMEQTDKLADRRRVEEAAGVPRLVETARNAEPGADPHTAL